MDLTTKYLGLKLRSPLVVSASPLSEDIDNLKRMEDAGAAAMVLYSLFEEQLRQDRLELHKQPAARHGEFCRGADLFSRAGRIQARPGGISQAHRRREKGDAHSHHRQPERLVRRRLDGIRQADPAGRRGRAGAEHLLHPDRHEFDRHGSRDDLHRHLEGGEIRGDHSGGGEVEPVLQQLRQHGQAARPGRRERAGVVQPVLPAGHRTGIARSEAEHFVEHADGDAPAAALDRAAARQIERQPRGDQRHPPRLRRAQDAHGRRGRDDALLDASSATASRRSP